MKTLEEIKIGQKFRIKKYAGCGVKMKMECLVNPEKIIEVVSKQLFHGPIMLKVED